MLYVVPVVAQRQVLAAGRAVTRRGLRRAVRGVHRARRSGRDGALDLAGHRRLAAAPRRARPARGAPRPHRELVLDRPSRPTSDGTDHRRAVAARLDRVPRSPVRDATSPHVVGVRALLPRGRGRDPAHPAAADGRRRQDPRAGVGRAAATAGPRRAALPLHVVVRALRGYDRDAQRCVDLLTDGDGGEATDLSPTDAALAAAGHLPGAAAGRRRDASPPPTRPSVRWRAALLRRRRRRRRHPRRRASPTWTPSSCTTCARRSGRPGRCWPPRGTCCPGRSAVRVERDLGLAARDDDAAAGRRHRPARARAAPTGLDATDLADLDPLRDELRRRRRSELRRMRQTLRADAGPGGVHRLARATCARMVDADVIGPSAAEAARALAGDTYRRRRRRPTRRSSATGSRPCARRCRVRGAVPAAVGPGARRPRRAARAGPAARRCPHRARSRSRRAPSAAAARDRRCCSPRARCSTGRRPTSAELDRELSDGPATFVGRRSSARVAGLSR